MKTGTLSQISAPVTNALGKELRPIKPPVDIPNPWVWVYWGVGLLVLAAAVYVVWRYWRKREAKVQMEPVIPAHIRAKQRLNAALDFIFDPREFCIRVSDTLRWYLEERFDFRAPERTTEEFLYELKATNLLTQAQKDRLADFLNRCDLVKFAKYEPREPELRDLHDSALRLVEETEPFALTESPAAATAPNTGPETAPPQTQSAAP